MPAKQTNRSGKPRVDSLAGLRRHAIFGKLGSQYLKRLGGLATERPVQAGTTIFRRSDPGSAMFVIRAGTVKLTNPRIEGRDASFNLLQAGEIFGEYAPLCGMPRTTDAEAVTDCELSVIKRADFQKFVQGEPKLALKLVELLGAALVLANRRVEEGAFVSVPTRLSRTVLRLMAEASPSDGKLRIKQRELAHMIQSSRETVNKHLREWTRRKWIKHERAGIAIVEHAALASLARGGEGDGSARSRRRGPR